MPAINTINNISSTVWINLTSLLGLDETLNYTIHLNGGTPVLVASGDTEPTSGGALLLTPAQGKINIPSTTDNYYVKSTTPNAAASISVLEAAGSGDGGGGSVVARLAPFVLVDGTALTVSPTTNYIYSDATESTLDLSLDGLAEHAFFFIMTLTEVTISVEGKDPTLVFANSQIQIIKDSSFENGFTIIP